MNLFSKKLIKQITMDCDYPEVTEDKIYTFLYEYTILGIKFRRVKQVYFKEFPHKKLQKYYAKSERELIQREN